MLILAIDSATPSASVALVGENKVWYEETANYKKTHSQTLMPMVEQALRTCECKWDDIAAIAVTIGPGSFTGLRIGLGTVKGLSMATGKPVVAVSTLDTLAYNLAGVTGIVGVLLDARKQEVYCCMYDVSGKVPVKLTEELALSPEQLVDLVGELQGQHNFAQLRLLGDGYYPYADYFKESLGSVLVEAPSHFMLPRAAALGNLAMPKVKQQEFVDINTISPIYLRLSEAEYRLNREELN